MTSPLRSATVVGVVSDTESYALMTPPFWLTNARPSAANRTAVGLSRPDQMRVLAEVGIDERARGQRRRHRHHGGRRTDDRERRREDRGEQGPAAAPGRATARHYDLVPPCRFMDGEAYSCHAPDAMVRTSLQQSADR